MKSDPKHFSVRIGQEEMGRILDLKRNLDHHEVLVQAAAQYGKLGWHLVALEAREGTLLELDFSGPQEGWAQRLADLYLQGTQVNLGVRTGVASQLMVLEVNSGEGALLLDRWGEWRSDSIAVVGSSREQHYYTLPPGRLAPPSYFRGPQVMVYGAGGTVLVPPSVEPQAGEPWRWLKPPNGKPPRHPSPAVWKFLKKHILTDPKPVMEAEMLSWEEIYRVISPHATVLHALLAPAASPEDYYRDLLKAALDAGLSEAPVLLGLLWYAPQGDARSSPERWDYVQQLVADAWKEQDEDFSGEAGPWRSGVPATLGSSPEKAGPDSETLALLEKLPLESPETPGDGDRCGHGDLTANEGQGTFNHTISGQFFQLLAGLGEKVIEESCRYESMLSELANLNNRASELERRIIQGVQSIPRQVPIPEENRSPLGERRETTAIRLSSARPLAGRQNKQQLQEVQAAVNDFLSQRPELAGDKHKVEMVYFCLKNYININPDFVGLSVREKLEKADRMARDFMVEFVKARY